MDVTDTREGGDVGFVRLGCQRVPEEDDGRYLAVGDFRTDLRVLHELSHRRLLVVVCNERDSCHRFA